MKRPLLARVLREPSYGWVGAHPAPSAGAVRREWLANLAPGDRRRWMTQLVWALHLTMAATLPVYLIFFATPLGLLAGLVYALIVLPSWGTFYLHRYGAHRAFVLKHPFWRQVAKHMVLQLIPEELYVVSHHVHHRYADQDGDPHDPRGGFWYCFLADANHQSLAPELDERDYRRVAHLVEHLPVPVNDWAGYRRWGTLARPVPMILSFALNHVGWYGLWWLLGGHGLAMGVWSLSSLWLLGIRQFNFRAHGRGEDQRVPGEDLHRGDLSVNRTLSAWLAGEWHNNHHLLPRSARAGYLPGQLDLPWLWIRLWRALGAATEVRDDSERFFALYRAARPEVSYVPGPPGPLTPEEEQALRALAPKIRELSSPSLAPLAAAAVEWATLAALFASTFFVAHPLWWALATMLIGARQHGLMVLMHEGVHRRLHRDPWLNDLLSDLFCAWPLLVSTAGYRQGHLRHHRALHTPRDPDWVTRHDRPEWAFPATPLALWGRLVRVALGGGVLAFFRYRDDMGDPSPRWRQLARFGVGLSLPAVLLAVGGWERLLVLWVLPIVTALPLYARLRVIAEHYGLKAASPLDATRDWTAGALLDWWWVPWNIRLHLTHHLFPSVPFHELPAAQRLLLADPVLGPRCHTTRGFRALLHELTTGGDV